jgi:TraM recognition site of TraD and TraG
VFWRKRTKQLDLSKVAIEPTARLDLKHAAIAASPIPKLYPFVRNKERDWAALGEKAWAVLDLKRMREIFPAQAPSEFRRYHKLLKRSYGKYRDEIFVGLRPDGLQKPPGEKASQDEIDFLPFFVPRFVFERHGYVLGGTGSGKTAHALAQILIQLAEGYEGTDGKHDPPPILIVDLKQNGDRYLRALAERIARARRQPLRFYSNDTDYDSMLFDPLRAFRSVKDPIKLLETLMKAFGLTYPEGYGSDFFTAEQRVQLMQILHRPRSGRLTMDHLIEAIDRATRGRSANSDARGLYSAMAALGKAAHVHTSAANIEDENLIDFDRFLDNREVLYVHLDARSMSLLSRDLGRLMLFSLLEAASQREKRGEKRQCFVAIDEFHRLAARNVVEMLEDARASGVGFLLCHQSSSSLKTRDSDLYGVLFENCSFKQCLTLEDPRVIELFETISGRKTERRLGGSTSETFGQSSSHSKTSSQSSNQSSGSAGGGFSSMSGAGQSSGDSVGETQTHSTSETSSWREEMVTALTPEMVVAVNDTELLSLIHVKGAGEKSLSPTGGIPTLVQGLFPFHRARAEKWYAKTWPLKKTDGEGGQPGDSASATTLPTSAPITQRIESETLAYNEEPIHNRDEKIKLTKRILAISNKLADGMIPEVLSFEQFMRNHHVTLSDGGRYAALAGVDVSNRHRKLKPGELAALLRAMNS